MSHAPKYFQKIYICLMNTETSFLNRSSNQYKCINLDRFQKIFWLLACKNSDVLHIIVQCLGEVLKGVHNPGNGKSIGIAS